MRCVITKIEEDPKLVIHCKSFEEDASIAIRKILAECPDAIFCINDLTAIMAIQYARKKGYSIPGDIRIVGFNNDPVSGVVQPALTTVMQPGYEVGKLAIGVLIDEIEKKTAKHKMYTLRTRLVTRQSSR